VTYVATANFAENLPGPILDRFRSIDFTKPQPDDLQALSAILANLARERGLDPRFVPPLSGAELSAIAKHWRGGSLRLLRRIVEVVLSRTGRARSATDRKRFRAWRIAGSRPAPPGGLRRAKSPDR
jgi:ATP-dependent Lon protease